MLKEKNKWHLRNRRNTGFNTTVLFIGFFVCFVTLGYAILSTTLGISGPTKIASSTWDVHFANVRVFDGSVEAPLPTVRNTNVSYNVTLNQPKDYYRFLVDIENTGNIDAMIKTITIPTVSEKLEFSATYKDGTEIKKGDSLKGGDIKTIIVTLKYKDKIALTDITQEVLFGIEYTQADVLAEDVEISNSDVYFKNIRVFGGGVAPTIEATINNVTSVLFEATLSQANDYYKFLIDVENTGTNDAMIKEIITPTISNKLEFTATYKDGTAISVNDILKAGDTKTLLISLKYKNNATVAEVNQNIQFTIKYDQADASAKELTTEYTVNDLINLSNGITTQYYTDGIKSEMYAFEHEATDQLVKNIDYRYIGNIPNNYINFNGEIWRIIGVFQTDDGKNRLKIVKDERISNANIMWDYKKDGVGSSNADKGSNDWTDAQLMYFLNPDDIEANALAMGYTYENGLVKDKRGIIIYEKGKRPAEVSYKSTEYTGELDSWAIGEDKKYIDNVKYYLGGGIYSDLTYWGTTSMIYSFERGEVNAGETRLRSWIGKVGLMYASDYGYTFAKGVENRCYQNPSFCHGGVPSNSWLYKADYEQWLITLRSGFNARSYTPFYIDELGYAHIHYPNSASGVRPVVYLKPDIKIIGSGTSDVPYSIVS